MNELKIFVERCVRPVIREESSKLEMRRELYAHVMAAYEQELERNENDKQAALERTLKRMGDPEQVTKELQDSIGTLDRWTGYIDVLMHRPAEMPLWRYGLRVMLYFGGPFVGLLFIVVALRLSEILPGGVGGAAAELRFVGAFGFVWLVNLFVCSMMHGKLFSIFERNNWNAASAATVVLLAVTTALDVLVSGWLFVFLASGSTDLTWHTMPYWGVLAAVGAQAMIIASWVGTGQLRGLKEWRELEID